MSIAGQPIGQQLPEFEPRRPLRSFVSTVRAVVLWPAAFFSSIASDDSDVEQRLGPPVVFVMIATFIFFVFGGAYDIAAMALRGELSAVSAFGIQGSASLAVLAPVLAMVYPLGAVLGLFIGGFFLHIFVMLFAGKDRRSYYSTLKIFAYTSVTALLSWIPVVWFVASIYQAYLTAVGVRHMHCATSGRAAAVAVLSFAVGGVSMFVGSGLTAPEMILEGGLG